MSNYDRNKRIMLSISKKKYLKSLYNKKFRLIENKTLIEGVRVINEALKTGFKFDHIWIDEKFNNNDTNNIFLINQLKDKNIPFTYEKNKDIKSISDTKNSQGLVALIDTENFFKTEKENFFDKIVILDQISDPGNLGTIIRTCAWYGIKTIILSKDSSDIFNPKCLRSAMGGHFYIQNCVYWNYDEIINFIKSNEYHYYCSTMNGEPIENVRIKNKWALVLGSEAHGVNQKLFFGHKLSIRSKNTIESLNVSVASGILLDYLMKN